MSEPRTITFKDPITFYRSAWDIVAKKDGQVDMWATIIGPKFKCPTHTCDLDARTMPVLCACGWHLSEDTTPRE